MNNDFLTALFGNSGKKVKSLALGVFFVEAIGSIITGIILMGIGIIFMVTDYFIAFGLLAIVFGPAIAWLSSLVLYAFGELVDKTCGIHNKVVGVEAPGPKAPVYQPANVATQPAPVATATTANDGSKEVTCPTCNNRLSFPVETTTGQCPYCNSKFNIQ